MAGAQTSTRFAFAEAAASGTLMGFGFGAFGSAVSYKNTAQAGKALNESGLGGALIELGKTMDEGSAAYTFATELAGKETVSDADVGKLYGLITEQAQDMTPAQIFKKAIEARGEDYRVISQEDVGGVSEADVADFNAKTGMKATPEEFAQAGRELAQDQEAVRQVHAEREAGGVKYTPPTAKDIKAYSTEDTEVYSKALSRTVYMYDGASHAQAEAGFAENGVVYINKNAPVNRNSVAVVLAHEYTHTIEGTNEYSELMQAVFQSKGYQRMLMSAGEGSHVSITHEEYLQQIIDNYARSGVVINEAGAQKEAVAKYLSEYLFQNVEKLTNLARTDRTIFEKIRAAVRRFIARLHDKTPNKRDLIKLERLFAKAAKAAQTQKSPATTSGVQYMSKSESENSSIKQQLREHREEIADMDPVAVVSYKPQNKKDLRTLAIEEFKKFGYRVDRPNFGIIEIGEKQIERSLEYINTDAEKAALLTVPRVLKRGRMIDGHLDHKGRAYGTVTIAAPVKINGVVGNVAVVVRRTGKNAYHTHRILMPDGSEFVFENTKNAEPTSLDMPTKNGDQGPSISSASDYSIPGSSEKSNPQYSLPSRSALQTPSYLELTPEQRLERDTKEASRLLERKHAVDNAPPDVAPVLERIMDELDILRETSTPVTTAQPTAFTQSVEGGGVLDAPKQSADTSAQTNILAPTDQSAVGALHEAPAKESASLAPTDAELNEAFKAGAEGRRYVPKGAATSAPTTLDASQLSSTPLDVDEKAKTSSSPVANDLNTIKPAEPFQSGVTEIDNAEENNWTEAKANNISKEDKQAIMAYAVSKGVNMVDISKFDGDIELLKAEIDTLSLLINEYKLTKRKVTLSVAELSDDDFAVTRNNTIIINTKALRSREITEENLQRSPGKFAAKRVEGIVVHEFGHILSSIIGNKGVVIAQQAYYNIYGQNLDFNLMIQYLQDSISEYAVTYLGYGQNQLFDAKKYQEVLPEVIAKHNSNATSFTDEFIRIIKEGVIK